MLHRFALSLAALLLPAAAAAQATTDVVMTTDLGEIVIALETERAPVTAEAVPRRRPGERGRRTARRVRRIRAHRRRHGGGPRDLRRAGRSGQGRRRDEGPDARTASQNRQCSAARCALIPGATVAAPI